MHLIQGARIAAALVSAMLALPAGPARAQSDELYKAETIVTGTDERERGRGFAIGAEDVLIKLTGKAQLAGTGEGKAIIARAAELMAEFTYEDRMKGIPIHDEQGTRDRPHFLRMRFDAEKFDSALKVAGLAKWSAKRPVVAIWVGVSEPRGKYLLSREGRDGYGQREVLKGASAKRAVPIVLPEETQNAVSYDEVAVGDRARLMKAAEALGADAALYGTLDFDGNAYWNVNMAVTGAADAQWKMTGVSFDTALKGAIDNVAGAYAALAEKEGKGK
ncbi:MULTISPECIES: DUF2066 domain-containing protein [Rhodomicrobium]|uniref:DUF2066 domain-containing protein n=1 Tax=Rhodomicrobium TaxID=1068 RepID=UPI000B4BA4BF|nr:MULTISPECIES: DUF2066 domain-containing protein [Rhodomicrobium]